MDGSGICGLRFSVYYASPRASLYPEPYHVCSYHGIETDLVNLTTCVGYEIWRVSTTCTLVLESVKATSIVFLLGVGSFVCYKLYHRYKRRSSSSSPESRKKRATSWVSNELLDSHWLREQDLHAIKTEYFGPASCSDDSSSSGSELGDLTISLPSKRRFHSKFVEEKRSLKPASFKRMGHSHSSSCPYDSVSYNVRTGVNLFGSTGPPFSVRGTSSFASLPSVTRCRNRSPEITLHGDFDIRAVCSGSSMHSFRPPRPRSLPLHRRRNDRKMKFGGGVSSAAGHMLDSSATSRGTDVIPEYQHDSGDSLESGCSSRYCSEEEGVNEGDDEEEDDDDGFLRSTLQLSQDDGQFSRSRSGSLKGNFSPGSLLNRHLIIGPPSDDALPSDCTTRLSRSEFTLNDNGTASVTTCIDHRISNDSDSVGIEKRDVLNYDESLSSVGFGSTGGRSPFSPHHHHYRLVRDGSFGSEGSEVSVDTSAFNDIGRSTEAEIDRIQREIEVVKKDFLYLESCIGNVDFHGPTPTAYTELVKSTLSDISECSDGPHGEILNHNKCREDEVECRRTSATFKTIDIETPVSEAKLSACKPFNSISDQISPSTCSMAMNNSFNLSLEWDSMNSVEGNAIESNPGMKCKLKNGGSSNCFPGVDSGSDFGTPLTNGSPEPTSRGRSGSTVSLEWEEEFGLSTGLEVDDDCIIRKPKSTCPLKLFPTSTKTELNEPNFCNTWKRPSREITPTSLLIANDPKMWSSMESGYIEEYSESCASQQITPIVEDDQASVSIKAVKFASVTLRKDPYTDSAYHEGTESEEIRTWPVVGPKLKVNELYTSSKDFASVCHRSGFRHLRPIHKDGYSVIRAVLLQMLSQGYSALEHNGGVDNVKKKFSSWVRCHHPWLTQWSFARKLNYNSENEFQGMLDCLQTLDWLTNCVLSSVNKEQTAVDVLNTDPDVEIKAMEAMKLLMMKSVLDMHEALAVDKPVPVFALLLFARETSRDPHSFMLNHLNCTGDSRELDDLELYVLGNSVGVTVCVLHPGTNKNNIDIITYHPDSNIGTWPEIHLVFRENLKQYCVILR